MAPPRSLVSARWQLFGIAEETSWGAFLYQIYQKWIIDTNDLQLGVDSLYHIQNRILWMHDPKRFFTTDPKRVNTVGGNSKQF